ncbi:DUF4026 domain-containing protein [Nitrospira sp. Nam80]
MRIRKKAPKPASAKPPLYVIGYSFSAPSADELIIWYDLEYGGPLALRPSAQVGALSAGHGPWQAWLTIALPEEEARSVSQQAVWDHRHAGTVSPAVAAPNIAADTVLFAARLARGLTLLTQGTAFDLVMQRYSNPSDWSDRPLTLFQLQDHVEVIQGEIEDAGRDWFHTAGMSKFGLDELELWQPKSLPADSPMQVLNEAADQILRQGHNPKVGSSLALPFLGCTIYIDNHRTAAMQQTQRTFRRIVVQ